ncbi:acyl-[ACP]--phospholipid O-acyltransferase [Methylocystis sp. WRRC1]|uniref:acyl-[ACP]--phospholipid O-acyltransferase n=1 Tax=Methylocystis sp. WRRC1 TaxID=1732014 RepID=UPI001D136780|nr:acyl-[ACP]--phospholipid O-acyltransferase [Methylocystis sp. WRRC1]MCC3245877.1 acyl-[ACP]--phospholipid O-acyltransferase [Methylocystis sp. WRRC1]
MSQSLLATRRFAPLFWRQFFAAFNDNFLKNALVLLILFKIGGDAGASLVTLAGALFIAPFFLLSGLGGELADKYDKALIARRLSLAEIGVASVSATGFVLGDVPTLFAALVLFGITGALFGPVKYGILPDHLTREELPAGNALVESATFIAILTGTIAGGFAMESHGDIAFAVGIMVVAVASYAAAWFIPPTQSAAAGLRIDANIFRSTYRLLRVLRADRTLSRLTGVTSLFWLFGSIAMSLMPPLVTHVLHGSESVVTIHLAVFAIAIAVGSGLAAFLLHGRIVLLPAAVGSAIIAFVSGDLGLSLLLQPMHEGAADLGPAAYFAQPGAWRATIDLGLLALAGGLMIVPAFAAIQAQSEPSERARTVAAVNVHNAAFMAIGGLAVAGLQSYGVSLAHLLIGMAVVALLSAVWIWKAVVRNPLLDVLSIFFRAFYRLEVKGLENFEKAGPNPIVALNHVSFLDAAAILSVMPKEPVFAIDHGISQRWWVKPFLKLTRAIPLDPSKPLGTRTLVNAVKAGDPLVIFPEGRLTVTGSLMKVYDGAGLIAEKSGAMVVPVRIDGPEATMFSRLTREQARRRWFPKFTLTVQEPVRLTVDDELKGKARRMAAGAALYQIMSDLIFRTTRTDETLFEAVVRAADKHGFSRVALEDPITGKLTYRKILVGARALGEKIAAYGQPGDAIGIMLPNANGAGVAFLAVTSAGRAPAMINFTAGAANILSGCEAAQVKTILTSRGFIEKGKLEKLVAAIEEKVQLVYLEDVRATIGLFDKLRAMLRFTKPVVARKPDDMAAILFTSGSEGAPKGVALSHRNMLANAAQAAARIDFGRADKVFNVLPIFHSFGLTIGFMLPLISGVPVYFYPSPLHYRIVPELVYGTNATILFGTDTFLAGYARSAHAYDFRSIRYVVAGAEPVKQSTRDVWSEKFGIRILEGYGVTETAPVLALNTPMFNKFGTVGRLMPGVDYRLETVPGVEEGGRLLVRGPNVMMGYLKADRPGVLQPPEGGWYDTGDIVTIDAQGFVTIKGRAKRFAKIGGEMVSLAAIEQLAAELWPKAISAAATEVDPRKGERIVLVTQEKNATRADFQAYAKSKGAADLMVPAEVLVVEKVPLLGSGKLDFAGVTKMVRDRGRYMANGPRLPNGLLGRIDGSVAMST